MKIIEYTGKYRDDFKNLNLEWLEKYFEVEPVDYTLLSDPENQIIKKGGYIYLARQDNTTIGTVALLKKNASTYELSKMAVTENFQGKGIGKKLLDYCIDVLKVMNVEKLILYSNSKLIPAIELYKKRGFKEIDLDSSDYKRANIKMEFDLTHE